MYLKHKHIWVKLLLHEVQFTYFKSHINDEKINHNCVIITMKHETCVVFLYNMVYINYIRTTV